MTVAITTSKSQTKFHGDQHSERCEMLHFRLVEQFTITSFDSFRKMKETENQKTGKQAKTGNKVVTKIGMGERGNRGLAHVVMARTTWASPR